MLLDLRSLWEASAQTLAATAAAVQLVAPTATPVPAVTLQPAATVVRVAAPSASLVAGGVTLAPTAAQIRDSAPAATLSTAVTLSAAASALQIRAPAATLVAGAVVLEEIPLGVTIFADNRLEDTASVVAVTPAGAAALIARLFDRDHDAPWTGDPELTAIRDIAPLPLAWNDPTSTVISIDLGSNLAVTGWALVNHNLTGITVTLKGDTTSPPSTTRDSFSATAVDTLRTFASLSLRYWTITIPAMATAPSIGELLLGVPAVINERPFVEKAARVTVGNVRRDRSPAGHPWSARRGVSRRKLPWGWNGLSATNLTLVETAFADCEEGVRNVLVRDESGTLRWMTWMDEALEPRPTGIGVDGEQQYDLAITLEQVPLT